MSDEEIRIAVAELCGRCTCKTYKKTGDWETAVCDECGQNPYNADHEIPNYPEDLNAIREAVMSLDAPQSKSFLDHLECIVVRDCPRDEGRWYKFHMNNATARQRAEAFLRVHGRWQEARGK